MSKKALLHLHRRSCLLPINLLLPHATSSTFSSASTAILCDREPADTRELEVSSSSHECSVVSCGTEATSKWVILPAVPRLRGLARVLGQKELTALKWVTRCCPEMSHNAIEKLFRMRQVRISLSNCQLDESSEPKLKRIPRKEIVPEGTVLYLPKSVLRFMEENKDCSQGAETLAKEIMGNMKPQACNKKEYKPTHDDIEWARELVLHMDAHILAINKPAGLAVQGGVGVGQNLDALLGPALSFDYDESPKLVHRLDKETSGVMIIGRTQESAALLHDLFRAKTDIAISGCKDAVLRDRIIKRKYWALVIGTPNECKGRIKAPLKKVVLDGGKSETIVVADDPNSEDSQEAITDYRVLGPSVHGCTWLELHPLTGRKHQLRVHCAQALGMPILGDYKYGRQIHESWSCKEDSMATVQEKLRGHEHSQSTSSKKSRLSLHVNVEGSVTSKTPLLHLHSRLLTIPKIGGVTNMNSPEGGNKKTSFVNSLRLLAPLPPHMKASWTLLPPVLKDRSCRQVERQR